MHLAYSAFNTIAHTETVNSTIIIRLKAYQDICEKYKREITAIQKYLPNWAPAFYPHPASP
ncbi:MAG TPA: hypothetical protein VGM63_18600 [Mucilaginibacter sp.]|jgi:hypothetical protein